MAEEQQTVLNSKEMFAGSIAANQSLWSGVARRTGMVALAAGAVFTAFLSRAFFPTPLTVVETGLFALSAASTGLSALRHFRATGLRDGLKAVGERLVHGDSTLHENLYGKSLALGRVLGTAAKLAFVGSFLLPLAEKLMAPVTNLSTMLATVAAGTLTGIGLTIQQGRHEGIARGMEIASATAEVVGYTGNLDLPRVELTEDIKLAKDAVRQAGFNAVSSAKPAASNENPAPSGPPRPGQKKSAKNNDNTL